LDQAMEWEFDDQVSILEKRIEELS